MSKTKSKYCNQLTPELQSKILDYLESGNYLESVAPLVGLSKETLYRWIREGERIMRAYDRSGGSLKLSDDEMKMMDFAGFVEQSVAEGERVMLVRMEGAGRDDWRMWDRRLAMRFPERYGNKVKLDTEVAGTLAVVTEGDPEIARAVGDILAKRRQTPT